MRSMLVLIAFIVLSPGNAAPTKEEKDAAKLELSKLNGSWKLTSITFQGKEIDPKEEGDTVTFKDGEFKWEEGFGLPGKITSIDPSKKPKEVDYETNDGAKCKAIYKLDGDTFSDCFILVGGDRPKEFKSAEDNNVMILVYKRVKKKD